MVAVSTGIETGGDRVVVREIGIVFATGIGADRGESLRVDRGADQERSGQGEVEQAAEGGHGRWKQVGGFSSGIGSEGGVQQHRAGGVRGDWTEGPGLLSISSILTWP